MYSKRLKISFYLFMLGVTLPLSGKIILSSENRGYRDIAVCEDQFIAVGTAGRIDRLNISGIVTPNPNTFTVNLNEVICDKQTIIAVGDSGTILISNNSETFRRIKTGTNRNINCISSFKGLFIAGVDKGVLLIHENGNNWRRIQTKLKGDIVSISADTTLCVGVTNKGEIIKTTNGLDWVIIDYNVTYKAYNKPCIFNSVLVAGNSIIIVGQHEDNSPVVLFSTLGNVWSERTLNYSDENGMTHLLTNAPNDVCYDSIDDCFYLVCNGGDILSLPSCSQCNKLFTVNKTGLKGIACYKNTFMVVGDNYYVSNINLIR